MNTNSASSCQVLSPLAKNLFHRAISQSSVVLNPCLYGRDARCLAKVCVTLDISCAPSSAHQEAYVSFLLWIAAQVLQGSLKENGYAGRLLL